MEEGKEGKAGLYHYGGKWGEQRANGMGEEGGREGVKTIEPK